MTKLNSILKKLWKDESAQGATEYILLLVIVVGIALLFKNQIQTIVSQKISDLAGGMSQFTIGN